MGGSMTCIWGGTEGSCDVPGPTPIFTSLMKERRSWTYQGKSSTLAHIYDVGKLIIHGRARYPDPKIVSRGEVIGGASGPATTHVLVVLWVFKFIVRQVHKKFIYQTI